MSEAYHVYVDRLSVDIMKYWNYLKGCVYMLEIQSSIKDWSRTEDIVTSVISVSEGKQKNSLQRMGLWSQTDSLEEFAYTDTIISMFLLAQKFVCLIFIVASVSHNN